MGRGRPGGNPQPSEGEWDVMSALWSLGSGTVAEVRQALNERHELERAYTTVLTQLRCLERKGCVRAVPEGRAHRYVPELRVEDARRMALERLVLIYYGGLRDGFAKDFVRHARLPRHTLAALAAILAERLRTRSSPSSSARS